MINVSTRFKELMKERTDFKENAEVTFKDGRVLTLTEEDFSASGNTVTDAADASAIPLGAAVGRSIQIELLNDDDHLESYDFYGASIRLYLTFALDAAVEKIEYGTFTVTSPEDYGTTVCVTANDDMYKADQPYQSGLSFPASAQSVLADICSTCKIALKSSTFLHDSFAIQKKPSSQYTFRDVIGYIAMLAVGNARIDTTGQLEIKSYSLGGIRAQHNLTAWKKLTIGTGDITVTGCSMSRKNESDEGTQEETVLSGKEGYVLEVENPLAEGSEETLTEWIMARIGGYAFRKFSGEHTAYPIAEFMDTVTFQDWKGTEYFSFITDVDFTFLGITSLKNSAGDGLRKQSKYSGKHTKTNVYLEELVAKEKKDREVAVKLLEKTLADSSGMYTTYEEQPDGSTITYLHDKPTLSESQNVIKLTSEAIGVSNDCGKTYPYGFVLTGKMITRLLYAEGINADYINAGAFVVKDKDGNTIFQADISGGKVIISADSVRIGDRNVTQAMQEIKDSVASARNMTMQLTNQYLSVPVDYSGTYKTFPSSATTRAIVTYGSVDITEDCAFSVAKSDSVAGTWNASTRTYKVTALSEDTGWVDIKATYLQTLSVTQRFNIAKLYAGQKGEQGPAGNDGMSYILDTSSTIIKTVTNEFHSPAYIKFSAYCRDGVKSRQNYAGRFKIEETTDGSTWTTVYTSTSDETSVTRSIDYLLADDDGALITDDDGKIIIAAPRQILGMRCTLYAAGGATTVIDVERIPVVKSVESLSQEEIFNILTNDGAAKGLFMEGNQLYVSFTYARGGMLALGGANNGNGYLYIYDADNNRIGSWTKDGINATKGTFSGELKAATGTFKGTVTAGNITGSTINGSSFETSNTAGTARIDIEKATQKFYSNAAFDTYAGEIHPNTNKTLISYTDASGEEIMSEEEVSGLDINANYLTRMIVHGTELLRLRQDRAFIKKFLELTGGLSTKGSGSFSGSLSVGGTETVNGKLTGAKNFEFDGSGLINTIKGSLIVYGDVSQNVTESSNTAADTSVALAYSPAYASPTLSDVGTGKTGSDGTCYVSIDATLVQAASETAEYVVFLQAEGEGSLYIAEKQSDYFVVRGTQNLAFAWKIEAAKTGTETVRYAEPSLQEEASDDNIEELEKVATTELPNTEELEDIASQELAVYDAEMEEIENENIESVSGD